MDKRSFALLINSCLPASERPASIIPSLSTCTMSYYTLHKKSIYLLEVYSYSSNWQVRVTMPSFETHNKGSILIRTVNPLLLIQHSKNKRYLLDRASKSCHLHNISNVFRAKFVPNLFSNNSSIPFINILFLQFSYAYF